MEKDFVPYEQALALKELGFDEPCLAQWDEMELYPLQQGGESVYFETNKNSRLSFNTMAPTFSQAFTWFRENYKLLHSIHGIHSIEPFELDCQILNISNGSSYHLKYSGNDYEEAELECLRKLIQIVKKQK